MNSEGSELFFSVDDILLLETRKMLKEFAFSSDFLACLKTHLVQNCVCLWTLWHRWSPSFLKWCLEDCLQGCLSGAPGWLSRLKHLPLAQVMISGPGKPNSRLHPRTLGSWPELKQTLNQLSHPGAPPNIKLFNLKCIYNLSTSGYRVKALFLHTGLPVRVPHRHFAWIALIKQHPWFFSVYKEEPELKNLQSNLRRESI